MSEEDLDAARTRRTRRADASDASDASDFNYDFNDRL